MIRGSASYHGHAHFHFFSFPWACTSQPRGLHTNWSRDVSWPGNSLFCFSVPASCLIVFFDGSRLCLMVLLGTLASRAQWSLGQVCCCRLQTTSLLRGCKDSLPEHPLNSSHTNMSKVTMPTEKLLLGFRWVDIAWHS